MGITSLLLSGVSLCIPALGKDGDRAFHLQGVPVRPQGWQGWRSTGSRAVSPLLTHNYLHPTSVAKGGGTSPTPPWAQRALASVTAPCSPSRLAAGPVSPLPEGPAEIAMDISVLVASGSGCCKPAWIPLEMLRPCSCWWVPGDFSAVVATAQGHIRGTQGALPGNLPSYEIRQRPQRKQALAVPGGSRAAVVGAFC